MFFKTFCTAASKRLFQKGETGKRAGNSICTGGTQADTASKSTGNAEAERLAPLLSCHPVPFSPSALELLCAGSQPSVSDILAIGGDTLGEGLDRREGHAVTDKNIYRCSTCLLHNLHACRQASSAIDWSADMLSHSSYRPEVRAQPAEKKKKKFTCPHAVQAQMLFGYMYSCS